MEQSDIPIITIDGPSGAGKGTVCQKLAEKLGWHLLDTGALYRALAYAASQKGLETDQIEALENLASCMDLSFDGRRVLLEGKDITDQIRTEKAGNAASKVAALPSVRQVLLAWQRNFAKYPGLIADGRDAGTVVFPQAQVKIFLTASAEERAMRRYKQLKEKGLDVNVHDLEAEIRERDERDRNRSAAPLKASTAAHEVDSTGLSIDEVFETVLTAVKKDMSER